jgi:hypothetical protein
MSPWGSSRSPPDAVYHSPRLVEALRRVGCCEEPSETARLSTVFGTVSKSFGVDISI